MWWRIFVILLILFVTIEVAHGEEQFINPIQQVVIKVDKTLHQLHDRWKDSRPLGCIEDMVPLDDFKFVFKPKIIKSIKKGEFRYYVGFKFTF